MPDPRPVAHALSRIFLEIEQTTARLQALHAAKLAVIVADFKNGMAPKDIAAKYDMDQQTVRHMLWRAGHTVRGRAKVRQQVRLHAIVTKHTGERHTATEPQP